MNNLSTNGPNLKGRDKLQLPSLCATLPIKPPQHVPTHFRGPSPVISLSPSEKFQKELRFQALTFTVLLVVAFSKVRRIAIDARQREISLITWLFSYDINTVRIIIDGTTVLNLVSVCIANLLKFNTSFLSLIILALLIFNHWILPTSSKGSLHNCSRQCLGRRLSYLTPAHLLLRCP